MLPFASPIRPISPQRRKKKDVDPRLVLVGAAAVIVIAIVMMLFTRERSGLPDSEGLSNNLVPIRGTAPDFSLTGIDGPVALSDFQGQYVLINFWATWCLPCTAELPDLYAYHRQHQEDGFSLLAVNNMEDPATVRDFMQSSGFDFPVGLDVNGMVQARYGVDSLPTSFLVGPDGQFVKAWKPGALSRATLDRDITPLLGG